MLCGVSGKMVAYGWGDGKFKARFCMSIYLKN